MRETLALHVRAWTAALLIAGCLLSAPAGWARPAPWSLISKATHPAVSPTRAQDQLLGEWIPVPPPRLRDHLSLYDVAHQRLLVFGGDGGGSLRNDLWELTLSGAPTWHLLTCVGPRPSARTGMTGIYDARRDRIVLFGGQDGAGVLGDVWTLALNSLPLMWVAASPAGTPPIGRAYHSAAYDSLGDRMLMFGGEDTLSNGPPSGLRQDIWQLTLAGGMAWSELAPPEPLPSSRAGAMAAVDLVHDRLIVFGGYDGVGLLAETWAYHLDEDYWQLLSTGSSPGARVLAGACVDPIHERMLMSGGYADLLGTPWADIWSFGFASGTWTEIVGGGGPPSGRAGPGLVYDSPRNRALLYGGSGETTPLAPDLAWTLSFSGFPHWDPVTMPAPPDRVSPASIYDPVRRQMLVHGGEWQGTRRGDLWALSMDQEFGWSQPVIPTNIQPAPSPRSGHAIAYDSMRDRMILLGGSDPDSLRSDLYAINLPLDGTHSWEVLSTSGSPPPPRQGHAMVYDGPNDRMIVFGGETATGLSNEVWELEFGPPAPLRWTKFTPVGTPPPPRARPSVIFDSMRGHLVVFGGGDDGGKFNDSWILDLSGGGSPSWTQLSPSGPPPSPRTFAAAVYDSIGDRMFVYGGAVDDPFISNELWALSLDAPAWNRFSTVNNPQVTRFAMAAAFDPVGYRLAIYGGCCNDPSDAWILAGDISTPTLASLVSAGMRDGRAEIRWQISEPGATVEIERREESEDWRVMGLVRADGSGRVTFTDDSVRPGHRYAFALRIGADRVAEAWVDVPATARLALEGFQPNPSAGEASIAFTLPASGSARLDVMDVSGRRWYSRTLGGLDAGRHVIALEGLGRLPAGLYLLRLTQRGTSVTRRATLLR
jgi:hypothetical protein